MTEMKPATVQYTADVVVLTRSGHVLLVERGWPPFEGAWALPGGYVEAGEAPYATADRELAEEVSVEVPVGALHQIGVWDQSDRAPCGTFVTFTYMAHRPRRYEGHRGDDSCEARWWPLNDLPGQMAFDHADIIMSDSQAADGSRHPAGGSASTEPWPQPDITTHRSFPKDPTKPVP
ncbi:MULTISPECIES: NUDIX hydrolase [unclassified Streptomyces]|uniref:NUDIX hydrolase n=1 Tax=unclassified Streptomyces TaxID=2593676 RepID=UPI002E35387E|nr:MULTISPECIES: NUDIX hydrolase [unclassified Streptomyces]